MRATIRPFAVIARPLVATATLLMLSACAIHGPDVPRIAPLPDINIVVPDIPLPDLVSADDVQIETIAPPVAPTVTATHYALSTPTFDLSADTEARRDAASKALRATSDAFTQLIGDPAPRIAFLASDANVAATRVAAAEAWLEIYSAEWRAALDEAQVRVSDNEGRVIDRAPSLPDWLHAATLRVLTAPDSSLDVISIGAENTLPFPDLFAYRLSAAQVEAIHASLSNQHQAAVAFSRNGDVVERTRADAFMTQSASVLRFLRETQGNETMADIYGATVAGLDMREILRRLPTTMTTEQFEAAWRAWQKDKAVLAESTSLTRN